MQRMGLRSNFVVLLPLLLFLTSIANAKGQSVFDVTTYGAQSDADITQVSIN